MLLSPLLTATSYPFRDPTLPDEARAWDLIGRLTSSEKHQLLTSKSFVVDRLGGTEFDGAVQSMAGTECLHGVVNVYSNATNVYLPDGNVTSFPQAIGLAASWNASLLHAIGDATSTEAVALRNLHRARNDTGGGLKPYLTCWAPVVNIARDARWGRVPETYGEDPFLTQTLAAQMVQGLQGSHPRYLKVAAAVKHFTVYDGPEEGRFAVDAAVPPRDLEATWLAPWRHLVAHAGPHPLSGVMASYSAVDGVPLCANRRLLTDALRTEMGFEGWVVSDCGCVSNVATQHHYVANTTLAAAAALSAGVDIFCDDEALAELPRAAELGLLREATVDTALHRMLSTQLRLGLYDPHDGRNPYDAVEPAAALDSAAHRALARQAAAQAAVLLSNEHGLLPLRPSQRVAVLGPSAHEPFVRSPWRQQDDLHPFYLHIYNGIPSKIVTPLDAIRLRAASVAYARGCERRGTDTSGIGAAVAAAAGADVAVVLVGLEAAYEQEDVDRVHPSNNMWALPGPQQQLVDAVVATGTPVVLVLVNGGPLALPPPPGGALLEAFYGGQAAGDGLADVLYGDVNPAGRMPVSAYADAASAGNISSYDMSGGVGRTYRYLSAEASEPLYPFGFGLSYTRWTYGRIRIEGGGARIGQDATVVVRLNVTNAGRVDGHEVAQLYLGLTPTFEARADVSAHTPARQLVGYQKVAVRAGATAELRFEFVPAASTGWTFFDEPVTTVHLAAGGVSPTRKTLAGMATATLEVGRRVLEEAS